MKNFKSHFKFNKQERSGIFFLLLLIIVFQVGYFVFRSFSKEDATDSFSVAIEMQAKIDTLKQEALRKDAIIIYPFNPNFITDYKGYSLGMSVQEIDRLHNFRSKNTYVNSREDFQKVTQVSDSLLSVIAPYFKFPEWTKQRKQNTVKPKQYNKAPKFVVIKNINLATAEELKSINGIGDKLSARIIKFRDRLGGFLVNEQLYDVYGLESHVVDRLLKKYNVHEVPSVKKININSASVYELQKLIYLQRKVAISIVNYRNDNKTITSFEELLKIENFPVDKIDRITLYLSL